MHTLRRAFKFVSVLSFWGIRTFAQSPLTPPQALVVSAYDRIENRTHLYTDTLTVETPVGNHIGLAKFHLSAFYDGKTLPSPSPTSVGIIWNSTFGSPRLDSQNEAVLLVDDSIRIRVSNEYSRNYLNGIFYETLIGTVSLSDLQTLAHAKSVVGRLGVIDIRFSDYQKATISEFIDVLQGLKPVRGSHPESFLMSEVDKVPELNGSRFDAPRPNYPDEAKRDSLVGAVSFQFLVDTTGAIVSNTLSAIEVSHDVFLKSSLDAIQKWKFKPGKKDGQKVSVWVRAGFFLYPSSKKGIVL